jgi:NitT/TauT family transport system substrate-binding protein
MVARVAEILVVMEDPRTRHAMVSERTLPFTEFMHDVGTLKRRPASWHDLFFEDIHHLDGS